MPEIFFNLAIVSSVYQLVGAAILGWAIALTSDANIKSFSGTYFGFNNSVLVTLIKQRYDARFGVILLVLGILFQICTQIKSDISGVFALIPSLLLVVIIIAYFSSRNFFCKRKYLRLQSELNKKDE